nr:catalase-related domain-containing protein [Macrococcus goetzii]
MLAATARMVNQAKMFYNSLSQSEKDHLIDGFSFELGKCKHDFVKENAVYNINHVDKELAATIAKCIGVKPPSEDVEVKSDKKSPTLSMENTVKKLDTLSVAVLVTEDSKEDELKGLIKAFTDNKVNYKLVAKEATTIGSLKVTETFDTVHSTFFDGIVVVDAKLPLLPPVKDYIEAANRHFKTIGYTTQAKEAIEATSVKPDGVGIVEVKDAKAFLDELVKMRHWIENFNII